MPRDFINTNNAPKAIGPYNQAVKTDKTVYLSGQIPLDPATMNLVKGDIVVQINRVFDNIKAVCEAAGGTLSNIAKLTIYLTDLDNFSAVNQAMAAYFPQPYPARAAIGVASLPKEAEIEIDAIMVLD